MKAREHRVVHLQASVRTFGRSSLKVEPGASSGHQGRLSEQDMNMAEAHILIRGKISRSCKCRSPQGYAKEVVIHDGYTLGKVSRGQTAS